MCKQIKLDTRKHVAPLGLGCSYTHVSINMSPLWGFCNVPMARNVAKQRNNGFDY